MGLLNLPQRDRKKLAEGNALLYVTARIIWYCQVLGIPYVLENPWSSRCWITPILSMLQQDQFAYKIELHFCKFHERWRKPTGLLCGFLDLTDLARVCKGSFRCCSATGRPHTPLQGLASDGRFMTLVAQPYPYKLVNEIAGILKTQLAVRLADRGGS